MAAEQPQVAVTDGGHSADHLVGDTMLSAWDIVTVTIYFILVMAAGFYSMCRPNRGTVAGYFLAGRYMWWLPVGASLFASNIGSEHFIGLAGSGAAAGIGVGAFEFNALVLLQLLGWVFLPVFIASGVNTLPEYTKKRLGGRRIRTYLSVLSMILYIFTKISVNLYSGAIFLEQVLRIKSLYASIIFLLSLTAVSTLVGGLAAVIYTDTLQFFIMIGGSFYVMAKGLYEVGGYTELRTKYLAAIPSTLLPNSTCGVPRTDAWVMLRDTSSDMPWPGFLMGQIPSSIWYWCTDQMMVQRVMAARSLSHAQGGTLFAGYVKLLPLFIMVIPGMIARVLFPDEIGCVDPDECYKFCHSRVSCSNSAYPKLVLEYMPSGVRGIMVSVMLSALMSDLTSIFNSASTLFTMDMWSLMRPRASQKELLLVGRIFIVFLVVISIVWIPVIEHTQGGQLYIYIQAIAAYLAPPIAAIYCMALLWSRLNEQGAFWGLTSGFVVGVVRMCLDFYYGEPSCHEEDTRPAFIAKIHYMYFATLLFWLTVVVAVVVSLATQPPESWRLIRTMYWTRHDRQEREDEVEARAWKDNELLERAAKEDPSDELEVGVRRPITWYQHLYNFICGFDDSEKAQEDAHEMDEHLAQLTTLQQEPWEKRLLGGMLVVIMVVAVGCYTYFSVNPFSVQEVLDIQRAKLKELGYEGLL